jgi:hypothetical protein
MIIFINTPKKFMKSTEMKFPISHFDDSEEDNFAGTQLSFPTAESLFLDAVLYSELNRTVRYCSAGSMGELDHRSHHKRKASPRHSRAVSKGATPKSKYHKQKIQL